MRDFGLNLRGRVKNFSLPTNKPLMPLFEAVVNSFQAIEENNIDDGIIKIKVIREKTLINDGLNPIDGFEIFDNGIGLNPKNFDSFMESDSEYKLEIGGKGVGRFTWLKAFENTNITSVYECDDEFHYREFDFNVENNNVNDKVTKVDSTNSYTLVKLQHIYKKYKDNLYKKLETIARKLIFHCLVYFLSDKCPKVTLYDDFEVIDVNDMCLNKIITKNNIVNFNVGDKKFNLMHIKIDADMAEEHAINLCGNNRFVQSKSLSKYIVNLCDVLKEDSREFWYLGILRSQYLDDNVDMNRLAFTTIPENKPDTQLMPVISIDDIVIAAANEVSKFLDDFIKPIEKNKAQRIDYYISHEAPQYRHLKKYASEKLANLKPNLTDAKLDEELYKIKKDFDFENKKDVELLNDSFVNGVISDIDYKKRLTSLLDKITTANQSILADYVAHRKIILDLFEQSLRQKENGKYSQESLIHKLIFPMKKVSDEICLDEHNLWLIDEKLSYYLYGASDKYLKDINKAENNKTRPDIMFYDNIYSFFESEDNGRPKDSVVLIEFKRPMRDDYSEEDPVSQLLEYQIDIEKNTKKDVYGRLIKVNSSTKFYLYAICDISEKYKQKLKRTYNMHDDVDGAGFYRFDGNTTISVISFDKLKTDAKRRNKILFDKLGL